MKKLALILVMLFTIMLTGILYGKNHQMIQEEYFVSSVQTYMAHYPETMPDVIFDPVVQVPVY